ncbi:hypothetical protein DL765_011110 [Monosporascus sp. GIB2]|nr:hypothetical protein DL765_011110 [Monosporascus sp. GIB2]
MSPALQGQRCGRHGDQGIHERMPKMLANGGAYSLTSGEFIIPLNNDPALKVTVKSMYSDGLLRCWQVGIDFRASGLPHRHGGQGSPLRTD